MTLQKRRTAYLLAAVLLVASAGVVVWTLRGGFAQQAGVPGEPPAAGTGPARVLLNEVLFQPATGPPFVELLNVGGETARLDGYALANQAGAQYALPAGLTLPAGDVLLIRFDGTSRTDGTTLHAPPTDFLHRETGSLALLSGDAATDEALWSTADGPSFSLGRGGRIPAFVAGTALGRPRGSSGRGPVAWTVFDPADATPGTPNPFPPVTGMMPLSGAILRASMPTLSWYGVPTAARYRIQVAAERSFASPVFDGTSAASGSGITSEQIVTPVLAPGRYLWRVQAIFGDAEGQRAAFSRPAIFWLQAGSRSAARAPTHGGWTGRVVARVLAAEQPPAEAVPRVLRVPLILQQKDTNLLAITAGSGDETGARPWDRPWEPAPAGPFCARASIAMVTAFFGGKLSQDRISYEADKDREPGPMLDINTTDGLRDPAIERAFTFALGVPPTLRTFDDVGTYFATHRAAIDAGYPVVASTPTHAFVVVGWREDERGKYLIVNDPAVGQYDWLLLPTAEFVGVDSDIVGSSSIGRDTSFFLSGTPRARSDEPTITLDTDGDGVRDFDETKRFGTNPAAKDTDGDGVSDKDEIRAWMFDEKYGAAPTGYSHPFAHADRDWDNKSMEVDPDSDNGGCFDGMEDTNGNGKHEPALKEFYNFDKEDDACLSGSFLMVNDTSSFSGKAQKSDIRSSVQFSLREIDGAQQGRATVTHSILIEEYGEFFGCGNKVRFTSEPYQYVVDVHAEVTTAPDGTVGVLVTAPDGWMPPVVHVVTSCPSVDPYEVDGPELRITGLLRNSVFDQRVDLPLGEYTGTRYHETHIRQSARR